MKKRPMRLRQASAYWRLAQKARRAGEWAQAEQYQKIGDRKLREHHAQNRARKAPLSGGPVKKVAADRTPSGNAGVTAGETAPNV